VAALRSGCLSTVTRKLSALSFAFSCAIKLYNQINETKLKSQLGFKRTSYFKFQNPDRIPELVVPTSQWQKIFHIMLINSSSLQPKRYYISCQLLKVRRKSDFRMVKFGNSEYKDVAFKWKI
jgi:hypothetical protein